MKLLLLLPFLLLTASGLRAQDTLYYDLQDQPVPKGDRAAYFAVKNCRGKGLKRCAVTAYYFPGGQKYARLYYSDFPAGKLDEEAVWFYPNGRVRVQESYAKGSREGDRTVYYENGQVQRREIWERNLMVSLFEYDEKGVQKKDPKLASVQAPVFPGGEFALLRFLKDNLIYPNDAKKNHQEGIVTVGFYIQKNGAVDKIQIVQGVCEAIDEECLRVVRRMPRWKPALDANGEPMPFYIDLPVTFTLNDW
jgi:TonB family protein